MAHKDEVIIEGDAAWLKETNVRAPTKLEVPEFVALANSLANLHSEDDGSNQGRSDSDELDGAKLW